MHIRHTRTNSNADNNNTSLNNQADLLRHIRLYRQQQPYLPLVRLQQNVLHRPIVQIDRKSVEYNSRKKGMIPTIHQPISCLKLRFFSYQYPLSCSLVYISKFFAKNCKTKHHKLTRFEGFSTSIKPNFMLLSAKLVVSVSFFEH